MNNKVLYFEGAGCVPCGNVENCRIRTAFINDEGKKIYLELTGFEINKHMAKKYPHIVNAAYVDHCHYITDEKPNDDSNKHRLPIERNAVFEYDKEEILNFINRELDCDFAAMIVTDMFDGYHVHADHRGYNLMDDFVYRPERAARARKASEKIDMQVRQKLGEKYSKISLHTLGDNALSVRCYASDKSMRDHGMDPSKRIMTVLF